MPDQLHPSEIHPSEIDALKDENERHRSLDDQRAQYRAIDGLNLVDRTIDFLKDNDAQRAEADAQRQRADADRARDRQEAEATREREAGAAAHEQKVRVATARQAAIDHANFHRLPKPEKAPVQAQQTKKLAPEINAKGQSAKAPAEPVKENAVSDKVAKAKVQDYTDKAKNPLPPVPTTPQAQRAGRSPTRQFTRNMAGKTKAMAELKARLPDTAAKQAVRICAKTKAKVL